MRGRSEYVDIETMFSHVLPALRLLSRAVCWCGSKQSSFGGAGSERITHAFKIRKRRRPSKSGAFNPTHAEQ